MKKFIGFIMIIFVFISCKNSSDMSDFELHIFKKIVIQAAFNKSLEYSMISKAEATEDLDELAKIITTTHSYIHRTNFNYLAAIEFVKENLPDSIPAPVFGLQIHKLIQNVGDSHAWVDKWRNTLAKRYAPAKYGIKNDRIFAYKPDKSGLLSNEYPYVRSIDGLDIQHWFTRAADIGSGAGSSKSSRFFRGRIVLEYISFMRSELGLKDTDSITYVLESKDKKQSLTVELAVLTEQINTGKPFGLSNESRLFNDNIGYLRIYAQRGDELLSSIDSIMLSFKNTDALIIDARQCGGGKRSNLQALFPYFMNSDDPPYIPNVAKLRIPEDINNFNPKGKLDVGDKKLKYIEDDGVTNDELNALSLFLTTFKPRFEPPADKFTDYYFMAMTAKKDKYFYNKPVYLIMDFGVGSAGDIFVSTFKGWRNVTLVGTPSNGRSGNSKITPLKNSKVPVRLSTMVSYQKTGELFDWVGIKPDIVIEPEITDWLEQTDTVLDRVITLIKKKYEFTLNNYENEISH